MDYFDLPDSFTRSYVECALWSSIDDDGEPLDSNYDITDVTDETIRDMIEDCKEFQEQNVEDLVQVPMSFNQAGHDFWLTRNGHGSGFWDRDYPGAEDALKRLTAASKKFGEYDLSVDDDGRIYGFGHSSWLRLRKKAEEAARVTELHGRCAGSRVCVDHAADKRVPSCKRGKGRVS